MDSTSVHQRRCILGFKLERFFDSRQRFSISTSENEEICQCHPTRDIDGIEFHRAFLVCDFFAYWERPIGEETIRVRIIGSDL